MLIDNAYIFTKLEELINEKQKTNQSTKIERKRLFDIKQLFPKWLRVVIFHPINPLYSVFLQYKENKRRKKSHVSLEALQPFAVDFFKYCVTNFPEFETRLYYPQEDEETIMTFIENRLKSLLPGYTELPLNQKQSQMVTENKNLESSITKKHGGYALSLDGNEYFLPVKYFGEHTYIHDYGLKYLPEYIKEYIKGKLFLDAGAYLGDTSILLLKKYNPSIVYAYEPVFENYEKVKDTIRRNSTDKIELIDKGLGDKNEEIDIYIDSEELASCSTNNSIVNNLGRKVKIQITTIDDECKSKTVGLIKMDIEGAEYGAIKGALDTIKRDKPVLLISLYHTGKDFFEIPALLKEAVPDYQFRFLDISIMNPLADKILAVYP